MEKQPTATDFLLQCSQKLAIKCGKGGFEKAIVAREFGDDLRMRMGEFGLTVSDRVE